MICKLCSIQPNQLTNSIEYIYWRIRPADLEKNCPGYHFIEYKSHVESYAEISVVAWREFGEILSILTEQIYKDFKPLKIYTVSIAESVAHIHFHFVPRYIPSPIGMEYLQLVLTKNLPI
jgi:diadenosine tetraphosphate (Ap4A) HIT family hydrolase